MRSIERPSSKGFLFSLDALFALIVASAAISILLYADFTSTGSYVSPASQTSSLLNELATMNAGGAVSIYASDLENQGLVNQAAWPQFGNNQGMNSSTAYGPSGSQVMFTFTSNEVQTPPVAAQGLVAFGAGARLYALNASTGNVVINMSTTTGINATPIIFNNEILYANSSCVDAVSTTTNSVSPPKFWASPICTGKPIRYPLAIDGAYLGFAAGNAIYLANPETGAMLANTVMPDMSAGSPVYMNGEILDSVRNSSCHNVLVALDYNGTAMVQLWSDTVPSCSATNPMLSTPVNFGSDIAVTNATSFTVFSPNGVVAYQPDTIGGVAEGGVAVSGGGSPYAYVDTANAMYILHLSGNVISNQAVANVLSNSYNDTPSLAQSTGIVYIPAGPSLYAYSAGSGAYQWKVTLLPSQNYSLYDGAAVAFGNLYVSFGKTLYALGTYKAQPSQSMLDTIASMYLNDYGGQANRLMEKISPSYLYGMLINGRYAPSLTMAEFNSANSIVEVPNSNSIEVSGKNITITGWFYARNFHTNPELDGFIASKYGEYALGINASSASLATPWVSINASGVKNYSVSYPLSYGTWYFEGVSFNGTTLSMYINSNQIKNIPVSGTLGTTSMPLIIGCMNAGGSCTSNTVLNGSLAGVQVYGSALNSSQMETLYQEGAFGAPISGKSDEAWWQLDGSASDYSGNGVNGVAYNMSYNSTNYVPSSLLNAFQISKASSPVYISTHGKYSIYNISIAVWK
jgi:hypothetical protein